MYKHYQSRIFLYSASSVVHHSTLVTTVTDRKSIFAVCAGFSLSGSHTVMISRYYIHQTCGTVSIRHVVLYPPNVWLYCCQISHRYCRGPYCFFSLSFW